jgi:hypothetical protein
LVVVVVEAVAMLPVVRVGPVEAVQAKQVVVVEPPAVREPLVKVILGVLVFHRRRQMVVVEVEAKGPQALMQLMQAQRDLVGLVNCGWMEITTLAAVAVVQTQRAELEEVAQAPHLVRQLLERLTPVVVEVQQILGRRRLVVQALLFLDTPAPNVAQVVR